jgi:hypothetical protein
LNILKLTREATMKKEMIKTETTKKRTREKRIKNDVYFIENVCIIVLKNQRREVVGTTMINAADYDIVKGHRWYLSQIGYAISGTEITPIASMILGVKTNRNIIIDHINRNKLDNRRENLRLVSKSDNAFNSKTRSDNTSGHCGVSWEEKRKKWVARICINGKVKQIGRFETIEDAIFARKREEYERYF